jgi:RNA polymerase sigma factor (sigma-70 family)
MRKGQLSNVREYLGAIDGVPETAQLSDSQLLDRYLQHGDEGAFAALVRRYGQLVLGVCERVLRDGHEAEDAFQATFLVLVRKAGSLDRRGPLGNWLYGVAYRTAMKAKVNAARRQARERQAGSMQPAPSHAEAQWRELRVVIDEELNRLPNKYRAPLLLCYVQGKTNQQAARELGWPSGSMSRRISRGRQILRDRLLRRGILLSPALLFTLLPKKALAVVVPTSLVNATLQAAVLFGKSTLITAGGTSAKVIALAEEVAKALCKPRLRIGTLVVAVLTIFGGVGTAAVAFAPGASFDQIRAKLGLSGLCVASNSGDGERWALRWQLRETFSASSGPILGVALSLDGTRLAAGTGDNAIKLWNLPNALNPDRSLPSTLNGHQGAIYSVAFSPNGKVLASASQDRTIKLWTVDTCQLRATLAGHKDRVLAVAFSPDGRTLASGGDDQSIRLWDLSRNRQISELLGHDGPVEALAFAPDGVTLASGGQDGTVRLWDTQTGSQKETLHAHAEEVSSLAFSANGKALVTGSSDGTVKSWDPGQGKIQATFAGHSGPVRSVAVSSNGTAAFSGSQDHTMKQWLVDFNREGAVFEENAGEINAVACAGSPLRLANGSADGKVQLWELQWQLVGKR